MSDKSTLKKRLAVSQEEVWELTKDVHAYSHALATANLRLDKAEATLARVIALRGQWLADEPCQDWTPREVAEWLTEALDGEAL